MAYLMTDVAAGSNAALQMQKNMAAAPYVQQETAAAAEETQLKLQQDRIKAQYAGQQAAVEQQQAQATLEKTLQDNVLSKSEFEATQESKTKLTQLYDSPEYKSATSEGDKTRLIATVLSKTGQYIAAENALKMADGYDLAALNKQIKEADVGARQIQNVVSIIDTMPENEVKSTIEKLPAKEKEAVMNAIGGAYAGLTDKQVKEALNSLMFSASGKLAEIKIQTQLKIAQERAKSLEDHWHKEELVALAKIAAGNTRADTKASDAKYKEYKSASSTLTREYRIENTALDKKIESAQTAADASTPWFQDTLNRKQTPQQEALGKLVQQKADGQKKYLQQMRIMAKRSGDEDEINRVEDLWAEQYGVEEKAAKEVAANVKPDAAPAGAPGPAAKPDVTSTTGNGTKESPLSPPSDPSQLVSGKYYDLPGKGPTLYTKPGSAPAPAAVETPKESPKPKRDYAVYYKAQQQLDKLEKDAPPKTISVKSGVGITTKEVSNPEYEAWYKKNQTKVDELTAQIKANK